jgi:hypothetical protein
MNRNMIDNLIGVLREVMHKAEEQTSDPLVLLDRMEHHLKTITDCCRAYLREYGNEPLTDAEAQCLVDQLKKRHRDAEGAKGAK